jgi:uncharacterized membrane-anchored protein
MTRRNLFLLILAPQVLVIAGLIARAEWTEHTGVEVVLRVRPYDPMDLLAGRYIRATLEIRSLDERTLTVLDPLPPVGGTVYVRLSPGAPVWTADAIASDIGSRRGTFLRGRLTAHVHGMLLIDYGHGRYFIPEDAHDPTMASNADGSRPECSLVLAVSASGSSVARDFLVDGRPFLEWNAAR